MNSVRPAKGLLALLGLWLLAAAAVSVWPQAHNGWWGFGLALLAVTVLDAWSVLRAPVPAVARCLPKSLALGQQCEVSLRVHNSGVRPWSLQLFDEYPEQADMLGLPVRVQVPPHGWTASSYSLRPLRRGVHRFAQTEVLLRSPLGLWVRHVRSGSPSEVHVYPNFAAVSKYALLATDHRLSQLGIRRRRRRGEGLEFHQLREYRQGDSLRQIDWKATSRQRKLVSREYQDERDQQVFFLIDCGRRMAAHDADLSHFDMCLNAVLLLAYVALHQGDAVGAMTFSGEPRHLPARKGMPTLNLLLNFLFDLQPTLQTSDYLRAASEALGRIGKRSLIVVVTNLRDEDSAELLSAQQLLRQRHLVLLANLRESSVDGLLDSDISSLEEALAVTAAHRYLAARRKVHSTLHAHGALSLDVQPRQLSVQLVNRYLDIKRAGLL
jgi:uncharacterized protein (DUF58 family)